MDIPVTDVELDHAVYTGAELNLLVVGLVPIYEEHTARLERGYTLAVWETMDVMEKAMVIAQRRMRIALENIQAEAEIRQAQRNANRVRGRK